MDICTARLYNTVVRPARDLDVVIRRILDRRGMRPEDLANRLGDLGSKADSSYVSKVLRGQYNRNGPTMMRLQELADALEVPLAALLDSSSGDLDMETAGRIAAVLPKLTGVGDPVAMVEDLAELPQNEQAEIRLQIDFKRWMIMNAGQRREWAVTWGISDSVNILPHVAEEPQDYTTELREG